ncbi:hypothetical protein BDR05DRAFT_991394 [Suillus weaverae]|nr:hypothetical protein BDR05DRAFT_991394 [Suillus weaverae]
MKMAPGMLSCASQIVLAQADRDKAVLSLLKKLRQVYGFMTQDDMFHLISLMSTILDQISHQTLTCAHFIRDYSEKKNFWKRLGKNVASETDYTIQRYSNVVDAPMGNFRDQVALDVATYVHRTSETLDLSGMTYAQAAGLDTRKRRLPGLRTNILSKTMGWINDSRDDVPRVLWLSGPAGSAPSCILAEVGRSLESSKQPKRLPFTPILLSTIRDHLSLNELLDAAVFAYLTTTFYSITRSGEFTVEISTQKTHFESGSFRVNGLPLTKFQLPSTKTSPNEGDDAFWAAQDGLSRVNSASNESHLFAWKYAQGTRPLATPQTGIFSSYSDRPTRP